MRPLRQAPAVALAALIALIAHPVLHAKDAKGIDAADAAQSSADEDFGTSLVWAARWQTWIPVIYNPSYTEIPYPNGDVAWYFGVCTDVLVRAYRWLGVDLQVEVKRAHVGSGDTNIDHRRVEVLRRFFAHTGQSLPITDDPADYKPGDVVSYYVPTGHFSKTHIAIVSDRKATGGAPLIIHNRGFGVQEENRLFAETITGHYRYWPKAASSSPSAKN
jgi:uncharacterized protein YijF (DUF1287 family)